GSSGCCIGRCCGNHYIVHHKFRALKGRCSSTRNETEGSIHCRLAPDCGIGACCGHGLGLVLILHTENGETIIPSCTKWFVFDVDFNYACIFIQHHLVSSPRCSTTTSEVWHIVIACDESALGSYSFHPPFEFQICGTQA